MMKIKTKITELPPGNWNFNYLVEMNNEKYVYKIYCRNTKCFFINSGKTEFELLKLLEKHNIAPKPIKFDGSKNKLKYDYLIYHYIEGKQLSLSNENIKKAAELLARLHSVDISNITFLKKSDDTISSLIKKIKNSLKAYKQKNADKKEIEFFENIFNKIKKSLKNKNLEYENALTHTDLVPSNFIKNKKGIFLIDWQTPKISDPAFDVWAFISEVYNKWDWQGSLNDKQKKLFLKTYLKLRKDKTLIERIKIKEPLYLLDMAIYCASAELDYKAGKIEPSIITYGREKNFERYEKIKEIAIKNLKKVAGNY